LIWRDHTNVCRADLWSNTTIYNYKAIHNVCSQETNFSFIIIFVLVWFLVINATFRYIMTTSFSGGRSRREPPTMGKQLENFITCGCESSAPFWSLYCLTFLLYSFWLPFWYVKASILGYSATPGWVNELVRQYNDQ
jgi:hypothetical protein